MTDEIERLYVTASFLSADEDAKEIPPVLEDKGGRSLDEVEKVKAIHCYNMGRLWEYLHSDTILDEIDVAQDGLDLERLLEDKSMGADDICAAVYDTISRAFRFGYYQALWDRGKWG